LSEILQNALERYGASTAIISDDTALSYCELDERASRLAGFMRSKGVRRGDRVAIHLRSGPEYVIADMAILKLTAVKVPLNELMVQSEIDYCLRHCGASAIIADATLPEPDDANKLKLRISLNTGASPRPGWTGWNKALEHAPLTLRETALPDDTAMIAYTGGTTGRPKGVQHSQHRLAINLLAHVICGDIRSDEIMLLTTPLPHSAGYHLQACLLQGGCVVIAPRFEAVAVLDLVEQHQITWTFAVPTMLYRFFDQIAAGRNAPKSLRTIVYGAAPMSAERLTEGLRVFGPLFIQLYGQTECPNYITCLSKEDHLQPHLLGSCGRAVPLLSIRIVDSEGRPTGLHEVGEVEVASPYLLVSYYESPEATNANIRDGWLKTGDLGYLDNAGYLFLVDRAKDMIISGGMNVYSVEVEVALRKHASVRDVAVIGRPDSDWGEAVVAYIVADEDLDEAGLRRFSKQALSAYKVPKDFVFIEALPLTTYGKIDKKALRSIN